MANTRTDEPGTNELANLVAPFWSEARVCNALGIKPVVLGQRRDAGTVLGLTTSDGVRVYPVNQFHRHDAAVDVRPALLPLLQTLRDFDPWTVAVLLNTPAPELDNQTPLNWVGRGGSPDLVSDLARAVAREWAAGAGR
jgi:hypothetical protein